MMKLINNGVTIYLQIRDVFDMREDDEKEIHENEPYQ